mgnify:CR=1 FL=1
MAVKPIHKFSRNPKGNTDGIVDPQFLFGNLAQTNHYQVDFSSLASFPNKNGSTKELLKYIEEQFGVNLDFISSSSGLLCSEASLPGSSLATAEVKDNFMGISQEFAHTRLYTDFDFTFYIDKDYNNLRFFEGWIDFISSGSQNIDGVSPVQSNYYRRMRYPDTYKCQTISITKFERNLGPNRMTYSFINAFPKLISAVPVSYGGADILKVSVSFNYDRYIIGNNGFSKGKQGSFADPNQQSAELQKVKNNILKSTTPPEILNELKLDAQARALRLKELEDRKAALKTQDTENKNFGIKVGQSKFYGTTGSGIVKVTRKADVDGKVTFVFTEGEALGGVAPATFKHEDAFKRFAEEAANNGLRDTK